MLPTPTACVYRCDRNLAIRCANIDPVAVARGVSTRRGHKRTNRSTVQRTSRRKERGRCSRANAKGLVSTAPCSGDEYLDVDDLAVGGNDDVSSTARLRPVFATFRPSVVPLLS